MSRRLDDLSSPMRPRAFEWLARLTEAGVAVMIIDTLRTKEEHAQNLANGASTIALSFHLPRHMRLPSMSLTHLDYYKSDAMDICPFSQYDLHGPDKLQWDTKDPAWAIIIVTCEQSGLESGGRWKNPHDPGHGQLPRKIWQPQFS